MIRKEDLNEIVPKAFQEFKRVTILEIVFQRPSPPFHKKIGDH